MKDQCTTKLIAEQKEKELSKALRVWKKRFASRVGNLSVVHRKRYFRRYFLNPLLILFIGLTLAACNIRTEAQQISQDAISEKVTAAGTAADSQQIDQSNPTDSPSRIAVPTDQPAAEPSPTPIQIAGNVIDSRTNQPLSATLYLGTSQATLAQTTSQATDSNGAFQLDDVRLPLLLTVEAPGYELQEILIESTVTAADRLGQMLEVTLNPQVTRGIILDAHSDAPVAGVNVIAVSKNGPQSTITDSSGTFELYSLLPDDLITTEAKEGYLPDEWSFSAEENLSLTLQPRQVVVTVFDKFTKLPLAESRVTLNQLPGQMTNAQGETTVIYTPAAGQIIAGRPGYLTATVEYDGNETMSLSLTPLGVQGVIRGADTGQPLPQTTVYLGDSLFRTDENGHFLLETLPESPTQVMFKVAGYHRTYAKISQTGIFTAYESPFAGAEGRWLNATPCIRVPQPNGPPCLDLTLEPFQAKAIYVPLHYLRSRERMIGYLDFIAATELNAIVIDVKGDFGFIAWDSDVELVPQIGADEWFTESWMPLDEFIAEAKARNVYTIARLVVFKDDPLSHGKPEWAAVREDGTVWIDREELGWVNPFREEVWDYNIELAKEVAAFGFDELNFDYIRFPSDGDVSAIVYEEENSLETRTDAVRGFMTRLSQALQPYGTFISADVFGLTIWVVPTSDMRIGQRIIDVAPQIDYLAPMVYPSTFGVGNLGYDNPSAEPYGIVYRSQQEAETLVPPYVKVRPWLQGYWYSLEEMQLLKQAAIDSESAGWSWWNAGGKYDSELFESAEDGEQPE